jgi:hypothetical protein
MNEMFYRLQEYSLPILTFNERMMGSTGYIDRVVSSDMEYPIMKGKDSFGRPFLCIKFVCRMDVNTEHTIEPECGCEEHQMTNQIAIRKEYEAVGTFFQRYTDTKNVAYGTCYDPYQSLFDDSRVRSEEELNLCIKRIQKCLQGETIRSLSNPWKIGSIESERMKTEEDKVIGVGESRIYIPYFRKKIQTCIEQVMYRDIAISIMDYI